MSLKATTNQLKNRTLSSRSLVLVMLIALILFTTIFFSLRAYALFGMALAINYFTLHDIGQSITDQRLNVK